MFGEPIFTPSDTDPALQFFERFDTDPSDVKLAASFIEFEEGFGWCCEIQDQDGNSLNAHDFASEEALRTWLREWGVFIG